MCTVSFIPTDGKVFITSNRDENAKRPLARAPLREQRGHNSFVGPKDTLAGGTWIALRNDGRALVLLNGAVEKHRPLPPYRKSRGQIFWDVFTTNDPLANFGQIGLQDIEPFTMVLWQKDELHELRWNGKMKTQTQKDVRTAHLWSSSTLYTSENQRYRETFFHQWLYEQRQYSVAAIHSFHLHTDPDGNEDHDIRINRMGKMLTVSVSCLEISQQKSIFHYADLVQLQNHSLSI
jgi:uncharacterized protein with NRDE domain